MANDKTKMRASDYRDRRRARPRPQGAGTPPPGRGRGQGDQRANARRNYERYIELARAAVSAGDPIEGENLYQHAEHYFRAMRELEGVQSDRGDRTS